MTNDTVNLPWSYVAVLIWRDAQAWLTRLDWMTVFGAILIVGTIVIIFRLSRSKSSRFDFADAFAGENGKTSMAKLAVWISILTGSWIMVALTLRDRMSENYLGLYLGIFVLGKVGTETVGVFRQAQIAKTVAAGGAAPDADPTPAPSERRPLDKSGRAT